MSIIDKNQEMKLANNKENKRNIKMFLLNNIVTIIFVVISILGILVANQPISFIVNELVQRISRNSFLVLALLIPVMAGMGLNFSIIIGAMAGQIAIIIVTNFGIAGIPGIVAAMLISVPFAIIFGIMTGRLLNKTKGQEMIASMIVGFFANGVYQFIFLFLVGGLIPVSNPKLLLRSGMGLRNTVDLAGGIKYAFDSKFKMSLMLVIIVSSVLFALYNSYALAKKKNSGKTKKIAGLVTCVLAFGFALNVQINTGLPADIRMLKNLKVPMLTIAIIAILCLFNVLFTKTKLGQDMRTVGQNQHVAKVAGIHVNKTRVIAITISTVLAAWGQIIFLQNIGVLNTYGSHMQIGLFSVAALLVGGASVNKATIGQAILGVILFHTLFIISPYAGRELFGDPQIGEFFRAFVAYGVIGLSLGLYAWKKTMMAKE